MPTKLRLTALAATTACLVCPTFFAAPAAAGEMITVVERATSDTVIDNGAAGDSAGDLLTFSNQVYDAANQNLVGSDNGWCIRTVAGQAWECVFTVSLEKGQISIEGPFYDVGDSVMSILGGTGDYNAASGEMKLHARNAQGSEYDFVFSLN